MHEGDCRVRLGAGSVGIGSLLMLENRQAREATMSEAADSRATIANHIGTDIAVKL